MQGWVDERTADGQMDGKMDPHLFGGYNIISCHFFVAGHKNMIKKDILYILNRLKPQAEEIIAEEQASFRADRSTNEQTFNIRILCDKYLQQQQNSYSS